MGRSLARDSTLDHMVGMEDEDIGGEEETAFQEDGNGDTDHQLSNFDFTSAILSRMSSDIILSPVDLFHTTDSTKLPTPRPTHLPLLDLLCLLAILGHSTPLALLDLSPLLALLGHSTPLALLDL